MAEKDATDSPPVFGTPPKRAAFVPDATWLALGQPKPVRIIISMQGDWWDTLAMRAYGRKRGNEHLMFRLLESNYALRQISNFPAGVAVVVPDVEVETEVPLVPWTSATFTPITP